MKMSCLSHLRWPRLHIGVPKSSDNRFQASSLSSSLEFFVVSHNTDSFWYTSIKDPVDNWIGLKFSTKFSILRPFVYENLLRHNISSLIGCDATTSPQQIESKLHCFDLLRICCGLRFVVQQIHNISTCRDVVDLLQAIDLSWICCTTFRFVVDLSWICPGFVYSLLHNKSTTNRISGVWALANDALRSSAQLKSTRASSPPLTSRLNSKMSMF